MNIPPDRTGQKPSRGSTTADMEDDDATVHSSGKTTKIQPPELEYAIKWTIDGRHVKNKSDAAYAHAVVLSAIFQAFTEEVTLIGKNNEEHTNLNEFAQDEDFYHQVLDIHTKSTSNNTKYVAITHVRTIHKLSHLKEDYRVQAALSDNNVSAQPHNFSKEEWDIAHLGFLHNTHVQHITKHTAIHRLQAQLRAIASEDSIPSFTLAIQRIRCSTSPTEKTTAYEIQTPRRHARVLSRLLEKANRDKPTYTPYRFKKLHPATFAKAVSAQNFALSNIYVVKVQGLTHTLAGKLKQNHLPQHSGYLNIVPTAQETTLGEWEILVKKRFFRQFTTSLQNQWTAIQTSINDNTSPFPPATITSRLGSMDQESQSK